MSSRKRTKSCLILTLVILLLQPQASSAASNGDISEALTYSGCTFGLLDRPSQFGWDAIMNSNLEIGLAYRIIDEGLSVSALEKMDTPKGRIGYNHLLQSWTTAGILGTKWKSLEPTYERGLQAGLKKWNSGATLGVSSNSANAVVGSKLVALCRVAEVGVKAKASKAKISIRSYVIKVTRGYLPPLVK